MSYSQVADLLNQLLESHYHADYVYREGIKKTDSTSLKKFFMDMASKKAQMINQLTDDIIRLNEKPREKDDFGETAANVWSELMLFFSGNSEGAILNECKKAEEALIREYNEVLKYSSITQSTRVLLESHRQQIQEDLNVSFNI
ncbi:MAG: PA2169 family four-helix-bundle protein [Sediminicola sp.]|tara:strand:+ start:53276 stop:53707 length:432 start_codon:yes stop_codon:yes gene_type:complete